MKREIWNLRIFKTSCPPWTCPSCKRGVVALQKNSLVAKESAESIRAHANPEWDPREIEYVFTAWAKCTLPDCGQEIAISGTGGIEDYIGPDNEFESDEYFSPKACHPMPDIIEIPHKCPEDIVRELRSAFALYWSNPAACASRIRVAIEFILDYLRIPRRRKLKSGKFQALTPHARIELLSNRHKDLAEQLMALKWLGNTGSHDSTISKADLLDAFQIIEHALGEIVERRSEKISGLARKLVKKHRKRRP